MNPILKPSLEATKAAVWTIFFVGTLPIQFLIGLQIAKWIV